MARDGVAVDLRLFEIAQEGLTPRTSEKPVHEAGVAARTARGSRRDSMTAIGPSHGDCSADEGQDSPPEVGEILTLPEG